MTLVSPPSLACSLLHPRNLVPCWAHVRQHRNKWTIVPASGILVAYCGVFMFFSYPLIAGGKTLLLPSPLPLSPLLADHVLVWQCVALATIDLGTIIVGVDCSADYCFFCCTHHSRQWWLPLPPLPLAKDVPPLPAAADGSILLPLLARQGVRGGWQQQHFIDRHH